jgi:hypothetical protein
MRDQKTAIIRTKIKSGDDFPAVTSRLSATSSTTPSFSGFFAGYFTFSAHVLALLLP